jgi:hypothetical protein
MIAESYVLSVACSDQGTALGNHLGVQRLHNNAHHLCLYGYIGGLAKPSNPQGSHRLVGERQSNLCS